MSLTPRQFAAAEHALIVLAPLATLWLLISYHARHVLGVDFTQEFWVASHRVLNGSAPYAWTHLQIDNGVSFPYPAPTALAILPFALLPKNTSTILFIVLSMVALVATLRILSVRDWRLYLLVFLWWPVVNIWQTGNLTLLLGLGLALGWRYRERPVVAGLFSAAVIVLKPFVWPVILWLLFTRRYRAFAWTVVWGAAINATAWAVVGYGAIGGYLRLTATVTSTLKQNGYGVIALLAHMGAPIWSGEVLMAATVLVLLAACWRAGHRRDDRSCLTFAVLLMLVATPLLWNHYFALLIVPLAITRPRLSVEWLLGLLFWLCPGTNVNAVEALVAAVVTAAITYFLLRPPLLIGPTTQPASA